MYQSISNRSTLIALEIISKPLTLQNSLETFSPKINPAPPCDWPKPTQASGSLHNKSHIAPSCGTS